MDFSPDSDQQAILDAVEMIAARHAGAERMRALGGDEPTYDHDLHKHLAEGGFLDLDRELGNRLEAALVVETIAQRLGVVAAGSQLLIASAVGIETSGPVAVVAAGQRGPTRFVADAEIVVIVEDDEVRVAEPGPGSIPRIKSRTGWPVGDCSDLDEGHPVDADPDEIRTRWRIALTAELVGTMAAALALCVEHVTQRMQFGRPIGSFQAVQHGLAECAVAVDGAKLLAHEAAWSGESGRAATALSAALRAADRVRRDTHQYTGALGFTTEYDLHLSTMRLPALAVEARSIGSPLLAATLARWPSTPTA